MQLRPPNLEKGDLVGITAPARWVDPSDIEDFTALLEEEGYSLMTGSIYDRHHQFAGNDHKRLKELQAMMDHPGIRVIFCARGGYGSIRLLEETDLSGFAHSPKWLVGFSDITALHALLHKRLRCESLHACMPYSVKGNVRMENPSVASMFDALRGKAHAYPVKAHPLNRPGQAEGILMGGNLSVLYSLTGTPFQPDTDGAILLLEDVDEYLYHIDRMMQNLKLSGMLEGLRGLVIGGMVDMRDNDIPFGQNAYRIIHEAVREFNYPLLFGFPAGHLDPNLALVLGRQYLLNVEDTREGQLSVSF
jgi:muramoyltetrapeptide carboxypeptidase